MIVSIVVQTVWDYRSGTIDSMSTKYVKRFLEITFIVILCLYFYKILLHFLMFIACLALCDSFSLLYQTKFRREVWDEYRAIRPITGYPCSDDLFLLALLYRFYSNLVFDICYIFLMRRSLDTKASSIVYKALPWLIIAVITGVGRLGWKIILLAIKNYDPSLRWSNYIMLLLCRDIDNRVIIYYKGRWHVNGMLDRLCQLTRLVLPEAAESTRTDIATKLMVEVKNLKEASYSVRVFQAEFTDRRVLIKHRVSLDLHNDASKVGYETAAKAAELNNYYGLKPMIPVFTGPKKPTTLLEEYLTNFNQSGVEIRVPVTRYLLGSLGGYDHLLFKEDYKNALEEVSRAKAAMVDILKDAGVESAEVTVSTWLSDPKLLTGIDDYR